jgi:hypothetical protein
LRVATTIISVSTNLDAVGLRVPQLPLGQCMPGQMARRTALFVGTTPSWRTLKIPRLTPSLVGTPHCWPASSNRSTFARDRPHAVGNARLCQRAVPNPVPPVEHLMGLHTQGLPNRLRRPAALDHGFEIVQQMRPTHLPSPRGIPGIGTPAIRDQI